MSRERKTESEEEFLKTEFFVTYRKKGSGRDVKNQSVSPERLASLQENLFVVLLLFYSLRHIFWGLDLWDTGYNYANFQYIGTRHMDPMWLFSTYLANVTGNLLTKLPNGDTLAGMNLYTGLFAGVLALAGYFFCTRKLKMPRGIVFLGEMIALSLCWCPTALLYNYLTYVLFLGSSVLLYTGLVNEKKGNLILAGILLGSNVLVRFSNLPEAAMIVAVWAYDFIVWLEGRKRGERKEAAAGELTKKVNDGNAATQGFWKRTMQHTLWCLLGYVAALAVLLNYIHIRYDIRNYIAGIQRLFAMTETASDYTAISMIRGSLDRYVENLYWVGRLGVIVLAGMLLFALAGRLEALLSGRRGKSAAESAAGGGMARVLHLGIRFLWAGVSVGTLWWLYARGFCSLYFYSYDPIYRPGTIFLMLTMGIAAVRIFQRNSHREEKLISGMLILIILLTPLGSNNGVMPSMNNLFLAAPYTLWESWRFIRYTGDRKTKTGWCLSGFPAKGILTAFLALCLFQFGGFGVQFAFAEATGIQNADTIIDNNAVLRNIKMSPEKARWMEEISAYVNENGLQGKEVILYGDIPALSYYLQMPAAFNPWSDLDSYSPEIMESALAQVEGWIREKGMEEPVVILENLYALHREGGREFLEDSGAGEKKMQEIEEDAKWHMLGQFMDTFGYEERFRNEKFAVYQ